MTAVEVLKYTLILLDEKALAEALTESSVLDEKTSKLLDCLNMTQNDIATHYFPIRIREEVAGKNIAYSSLSREIISVLSGYDKFFRALKFKEYESAVEFAGNAKYIEYSAVPHKMTLSSTLEIKCPIQIVAYGVLSEYFLLVNDYEDAEIFEERFKESLLSFSHKHGELRLRNRRWI